jgi:hypothetical protein
MMRSPAESGPVNEAPFNPDAATVMERLPATASAVSVVYVLMTVPEALICLLPSLPVCAQLNEDEKEIITRNDTRNLRKAAELIMRQNTKLPISQGLLPAEETDGEEVNKNAPKRYNRQLR